MYMKIKISIGLTMRITMCITTMITIRRIRRKRMSL